MNKKAARYGLYFYLVTMLLAFLFPKQVFGNIYVLISYLIVCIIFLYIIYFRKVSHANN